jgi:hypothetical protein
VSIYIVAQRSLIEVVFTSGNNRCCPRFKEICRSRPVGDEPNRKKTMKIRTAVILVGLVTGFTLPACAQQKATVDPAIAQQRDLLGDVKALDEFGVLCT